jgi:hypothetical protein
MKKQESIEEENKAILGKSSMYVTIAARFLGLTMTLFVLILTIKSELLASRLISYQLVLSIPFFILYLVSQAKMVTLATTRKYYIFNKVTSGISFALFYNALGLLISRYVASLLGILFFASYLLGVLFFMYIDIEKKDIKRFYRDSLIIVIILLGGLLPALGIVIF